jgi:hypothetical protein
MFGGDYKFGLSQVNFNILVVGLLLVILGVVSFNYYITVSTSNGISFNTGAGVTLLPTYQRHMHKQYKQQEQMPEMTEQMQQVQYA